MGNFKYTEETHKVIGAAMAVHRYFGCGFTEKVYQDALEQEFLSLGIQFRREPSLHIKYREVQLGAEFIPDFICYDKVIIVTIFYPIYNITSRWNNFCFYSHIS